MTETKSKSKTVLIALRVGAFLVASICTFIPRSASFDISSSTEIVEEITSETNTSVLYLTDSEFYNGSSGKQQTFTGSITISPKVRVVLERIGTGSLRIELTPGDESVQSIGIMSAQGELSSHSMGRKASFLINSFDKRSIAGQSTVIPLAGDFILGYSGRIQSSPNSPLLHSGSISIIGRNLLGSELYRTGSQLLDLGDVIVFNNARGRGYGIAVVGEHPGIDVELHVLADEAIVKRPPSSGYTIGLTLVDRVKNDGTLQGIWGALVFLLALRKVGE